MQAEQASFRGYLSFFAGQQVSLLGSSISQFVIIWWITLETQSAFYLSLAMIAGFVPMIVLTPVAGVFVDRHNRRLLIGIADFLQALSTIVLILLFWTNIVSFWHVMAVLAAKSICQAFHAPAVQAIVPLMVPRDKLSRINGLSYLLTGLMSLVGPVTAAFLLVFFRVEQTLWVDPFTFLIALLPLLFIRIPSVRGESVKPSFRSDFVGGLTFVRSTKGLVPLVFLATALNFFYMPFMTLLPYFVYHDHLGQAADLAIVMALSQAGMLAGGIMMTALKEFKRKMLMTAAFILLSFLGYALAAFTPLGLFWYMGACAFVLDFGVAPANVSLRTILQVIIPPDMQGRVNSVLTSLASAASPLGMIIAGTVVGFTGTVNLFLGCAVAGSLVLLVSWFFTDMRRVEDAQEPFPSPTSQAPNK